MALPKLGRPSNSNKLLPRAKAVAVSCENVHCLCCTARPLCCRKDGLNDMQDKKIAELHAALEENKREQEEEEAKRQAAVRAGKKVPLRVGSSYPLELRCDALPGTA